MANSLELAWKAWPILVDAAAASHRLTYQEIAVQLGYKDARVVRFALAPIQQYCMEKGYPPLTSIVVRKQSHKPGPGFIAWHGDLDEAQGLVFTFNWNNIETPFSSTARAQFDSKPAVFQHGRNDRSMYSVEDVKVLVNGRGPYQECFKRILLYAYQGRCALCDTQYPGLLIASHIIPWAVDPSIRLDPGNGLLLCRQHDALFEAGIVRIMTDGTVIFDTKTEQRLGRDLVAFLKRTSKQLGEANRGYQPNPKFLQWRLSRKKS